MKPPAVVNGEVWKDRQQTYFQEKKKGEMNELKNLLNGIINEPDQKKGREVIKKVIGYMTLGLDASSIFSEMCRASFTNDEVQKKMIYFYLTTYAEQHPDLSIMAVNTFKKDCKHSSSRIRGMALRNLCSFKSSDYIDNVLPVLREALNDHEAYVKKTAILGCLKMFYYKPEVILNDDQITNTLAEMIRENDPLVSQNALVALNEIRVADGGLPMSTKLSMYLLNRMKEYNEWGQTIILDLLYKYQPKSDKELYDIMSLLDDRIKHSSTAIVLGAIKIFLKYTLDKEKIFQQVIDRMKSPLITLMSSSENANTYETTFVILEHILHVIKFMKGRQAFEPDFKYFYFKADEPTYIKHSKLNILTQLASENNLGDMLNELNEYVNDQDPEISRHAIESLTSIAIRLKDVTRALLKNLGEFYKSNKPHLVNQVVRSYQMILRKHPKQFNEIKDTLLQGKELITEPESTVAFNWLLSTFAESIPQAPYILETYFQNAEEFEKLPHIVKSSLLTSIVTIFLKRPPEVYKMLCTLFKLILSNENESIDLRDRAAFYYRAMQANIQEFKRGIAEIRQDMGEFSEERKVVPDIEEFNTLCVIYNKSEEKFTKSYEHFAIMRRKLGEDEEAAAAEEENGQGEQQQPGTQTTNLMDIDVNPNFKPLEADDLQQEPAQMSPQEFESIWVSLTEGSSITRELKDSDSLDESSVQELFKMWRIQTLASAEQEDGSLKFFLYTVHNTNYKVCLELQVNKQTSVLILNTKCQNQELAGFVSRYVEDFLRFNEILA